MNRGCEGSSTAIFKMDIENYQHAVQYDWDVNKSLLETYILLHIINESPLADIKLLTN